MFFDCAREAGTSSRDREKVRDQMGNYAPEAAIIPGSADPAR
jgi:hypothetical protein